ncbi:universal stress protein [Variovorax sp. J22R133]|uniref:universal stress protein n=1 Tax=Variovorax brevis TaxID=3053503 RepID=UPI002576F9E9|nr:universal stress protein [Variovorax sp. J22R133]MDM0116363.1 universal stress protein [Variovorax sp. J22R133]
MIFIKARCMGRPGLARMLRQRKPGVGGGATIASCLDRCNVQKEVVPMHCKTILVHLDHLDHCEARIALAAQLSRAFASHLIGLVPTGLYDGVVPPGVALQGTTEFIAQTEDFLRRRAQAVDETFRAMASDLSVASWETRQVGGAVADAIIAHGQASDLIVLEQDDPAESKEMLAPKLVARVLIEAGRPVLVVPRAGRFVEVGTRVLVGWDGSRESAVALRDAIAFMRKANGVTLLTVRKPGEAREQYQLPASKLIRWLLRHGIEATACEEERRDRVADVLLERATGIDANLIVMGGYGHSYLRERILGGVTRQVLAQMTVPVLLAH